jgi:hypothetical protein
MTLRAPHFSGKRPRKVQSPQPIANLLAVLFIAPFFTTDFPQPRAREIQQPVQMGVPLTILEDAGEKPFFQSEWPNPTVAIKVQTPVQAVNPLSIMEDIGGKPFFQTEWPDPPPVVIQTPFQHQKHAALTVTPLPPISAAFANPVFPRAQQPYQLQKPLVLFEPCDFDVFAFLAPVATDVSSVIVETDDVSSTITENTDIRKIISLDATDVQKAIVETDDVSEEIC